jgi:hypothetical protein
MAPLDDCYPNQQTAEIHIPKPKQSTAQLGGIYEINSIACAHLFGWNDILCSKNSPVVCFQANGPPRSTKENGRAKLVYSALSVDETDSRIIQPHSFFALKLCKEHIQDRISDAVESNTTPCSGYSQSETSMDRTGEANRRNQAVK